MGRILSHDPKDVLMYSPLSLLRLLLRTLRWLIETKCDCMHGEPSMTNGNCRRLAARPPSHELPTGLVLQIIWPFWILTLKSLLLPSPWTQSRKLMWVMPSSTYFTTLNAPASGRFSGLEDFTDFTSPVAVFKHTASPFNFNKNPRFMGQCSRWSK